MNKTCLVQIHQSVDSVLSQTPAGKIAMFKVVSISSRVDDSILGEMVYIKRDKIFDCICDREIKDLKTEDLLFVSYVVQGSF